MTEHHRPRRMTEAPGSADFFGREWRVYRKMVDNNYLFHREAYGRLHRLLVAEVDRPFRFLDIACGDASATVGALNGTKVARYYGIDRSATALAHAEVELSALDCPVELHGADFADLLPRWREPVDVAWIGLSHHHFLAPTKRDALGAVRRILGEGGILAIYENASPDGEDRAGWLRRWDEQRAAWTAYSDEDWDIASSHVHAADFPETDARWHALGLEAGFSEVRVLYAAPTDLFRLYAFRA